MASQRTVKAVLLDGMGTLIRLVPPAPALAAGLGVDAETAARAFRAEVDYYVAHHLEGGDPAGLARLRRGCAEVVAEVAHTDVDAAHDALMGALRFEAFADAPGALRALRERGLRLVVASNWDWSLTAVLERIGLLPLLDGAVASAVVGAAKPDGRIFTAALELAGCSPAEALHVGDSLEADYEGATATGVEAVLLDRGATAAASPDGPRAIRSLAELAPLLSSHA
ncbi:MAG: HAD family hydrolase [Thermoleophilaceae bacterium]